MDDFLKGFEALWRQSLGGCVKLGCQFLGHRCVYLFFHDVKVIINLNL